MKLEDPPPPPVDAALFIQTVKHGISTYRKCPVATVIMSSTATL